MEDIKQLIQEIKESLDVVMYFSEKQQYAEAWIEVEDIKEQVEFIKHILKAKWKKEMNGISLK